EGGGRLARFAAVRTCLELIELQALLRAPPEWGNLHADTKTRNRGGEGGGNVEGTVHVSATNTAVADERALVWGRPDFTASGPIRLPLRMVSRASRGYGAAERRPPIAAWIALRVYESTWNRSPRSRPTSGWPRGRCP